MYKKGDWIKIFGIPIGRHDPTPAEGLDWWLKNFGGLLWLVAAVVFILALAWNLLILLTKLINWLF